MPLGSFLCCICHFAVAVSAIKEQLREHEEKIRGGCGRLSSFCPVSGVTPESNVKCLLLERVYLKSYIDCTENVCFTFFIT